VKERGQRLEEVWKRSHWNSFPTQNDACGSPAIERHRENSLQKGWRRSAELLVTRTVAVGIVVRIHPTTLPEPRRAVPLGI
jgi:hypothetical protein